MLLNVEGATFKRKDGKTGVTTGETTLIEWFEVDTITIDSTKFTKPAGKSEIIKDELNYEDQNFKLSLLLPPAYFSINLKETLWKMNVHVEQLKKQIRDTGALSSLLDGISNWNATTISLAVAASAVMVAIIIALMRCCWRKHTTSSNRIKKQTGKLPDISGL